MRIDLQFKITQKGLERSGQTVDEYIDDKRIETFAECVVPVCDEKVKFRKTEDGSEILFDANVYLFTESEMLNIIHTLNREAPSNKALIDLKTYLRL